MSRTSTEMTELQEAFVRALDADAFSSGDMEKMLVKAVRQMSVYEMERLLAEVGMDRYDLS